MNIQTSEKQYNSLNTIQTLPQTPHSWIEISKSALQHNAQQFKKRIGIRSILAFVVKANAYGHAIEQIGTIAESILEIDYLCTFSLSEALKLRACGSTKPILVLGHLDVDPCLAAENNCEFMVHSIEIAEQLELAAQKTNCTFSIHLKIDTGLSRFGISPENIVSFITALQKYSHLRIVGLATHLAQSQTLNDFNHQQLELFQQVQALLKKIGVTVPLIHASNSAAAFTQDIQSCSFFRVGLGMYGFFSSEYMQQKVLEVEPHFSLIPVLSWKAKIISIKKVPAGSYISYNSTHQVIRETLLGIIPVGYHDGYDSVLSGHATVLVNQIEAPILGRIAMNTCIIDITDIPNVSLGTEVTLIGNHTSIKADKLFKKAGIENVRTFFARLNPLIPRIII